jgi:hypothetical protein
MTQQYEVNEQVNRVRVAKEMLAQEEMKLNDMHQSVHLQLEIDRMVLQSDVHRVTAFLKDMSTLFTKHEIDTLP